MQAPLCLVPIFVLGQPTLPLPHAAGGGSPEMSLIEDTTVKVCYLLLLLDVVSVTSHQRVTLSPASGSAGQCLPHSRNKADANGDPKALEGGCLPCFHLSLPTLDVTKQAVLGDDFLSAHLLHSHWGHFTHTHFHVPHLEETAHSHSILVRLRGGCAGELQQEWLESPLSSAVGSSPVPPATGYLRKPSRSDCYHLVVIGSCWPRAAGSCG